MNRKTFIRFAAGIPLFVFILIVIILINEQKPVGISRGTAYKSAALLLTDRKGCEEAEEKGSRIYFPETDKGNWYVKYMDYLYEGGYLDAAMVPALKESAEGFLTYGEAKSLSEALVPGAGKDLPAGRKRQNQKIPAGQWWSLYDRLKEKLDTENQTKELEILLYGTPSNVKDSPAWTAYTSEGNLQFEGLSLDSYIDWELKLLVKRSFP